VNGVSKQDIDFEHDTSKEIKSKIEQSNPETIKVTRVAQLRKHTKNSGASTYSIIVYDADPKEANECITYGIYVEHRRYAADRYAPQCQIKQCFNCQGYAIRRMSALGTSSAACVHKAMRLRNAAVTCCSVFTVRARMPHGTMSAQYDKKNVKEWKWKGKRYPPSSNANAQ